MLQKIDELLTPDQRLWRTFGLGGPVASWDAVCPDTGAFLFHSNGRRTTGRPLRWGLILPNQSVQERGGLFESYVWEDGERAFVTAHSLAEAMGKAQERLNKMLQKRQAVKSSEAVGK